MRIFNLHYHKRFRMEIDLRRWLSVPVFVHEDYCLRGWSAELLAAHAEAKYYSFRDEPDGVLFPCLSNPAGCRELMKEIVERRGFIPESTWLAQYTAAGERFVEHCGTIQAIRLTHTRANIQNVGVTPLHRHRGLGLALVSAALTGLQQVGITRVQLEVTSANAQAVHLYKRLGFRRTRTLYKAAERDYSEASS